MSTRPRQRVRKRTRRAKLNGAPHRRTMLARFNQIYERREALRSATGLVMTVQRLFALMLIYEAPQSASGLASAVRALQPSALFNIVQRLRHYRRAYQYLYSLEGYGVVRRAKRDGTTVFGLRRGVRAQIRPVLDPLMDA